METNEKIPHTSHVTNAMSHSGTGTQSPRRLASWPTPVVEPPCEIVGCVGLSGHVLSKTVVSDPTRCNVAVVGVFLNEEVVAQENGRRIARTLSQTDAATLTMEWIEQELPEVHILHLFLGRKRGDKTVQLNKTTWRVAASPLKWSLMLFPLRRSEAIGVFRTRAVRDVCPVWLWHYLAGQVLLDGVPLVKPGATQ